MLGDHKRLVQIVTNLLGNATKYTPAGSTIDIKVTATVDTITLSVEDDGNELARRLRNQPETKHALLVALTGYAQEKDQLATQAAGFDQFFSKPLDNGILLALLRQPHRQSE